LSLSSLDEQSAKEKGGREAAPNTIHRGSRANATARPSTSSGFDEEPRQDIYFEGLTRTNAIDGMVYLSFHAAEG
jgi:phage terminase large subunit-like protein